MREFTYALLSLMLLGCLPERTVSVAKDEIPTTNHNIGFTPFDAAQDDQNFRVCDSTKIASGRNSVRYLDGANKLREDIASNYVFDPAYASFNGYVMVRFMVNCEGKSGRYRAQALKLDFSPVEAPSHLVVQIKTLIKRLDNWTKPAAAKEGQEYSKFINLKIENGKIQHILL